MAVQLLVNLFVLSISLQAVPGRALSWNFNADTAGTVPAGWETRGGSNRGTYQIKPEPDGNHYVAASSLRSDVQLGIQLGVKAQETPVLSWRWRVWELPRDADERNLKTLDSAASARERDTTSMCAVNVVIHCFLRSMMIPTRIAQGSRRGCDTCVICLGTEFIM